MTKRMGSCSQGSLVSSSLDSDPAEQGFSNQILDTSQTSIKSFHLLRLLKPIQKNISWLHVPLTMILNTSEYSHCQEVDCQFVQQVQFCSSLQVSLRHGQGYLNLPSFVFAGSSISKDGSVQCPSHPPDDNRRIDLGTPNNRSNAGPAQPIRHEGPIFKVGSKDLLFGISHSLKLLTHSCFIRKTQRPKTLSRTQLWHAYYNVTTILAATHYPWQKHRFLLKYVEIDPQISAGFGPVAPTGSPVRSTGGQTYGRKCGVRKSDLCISCLLFSIHKSSQQCRTCKT